MSSGKNVFTLATTSSCQDLECSTTLVGSLCSIPTTSAVQTTSALILLSGRYMSQVLNRLNYRPMYPVFCCDLHQWSLQVTAVCIFNCCIATLFYFMILFVHPPTDGHFLCVWLGTVLNAIAIHVFTQIFFFIDTRLCNLGKYLRTEGVSGGRCAFTTPGALIYRCCTSSYYHKQDLLPLFHFLSI